MDLERYVAKAIRWLWLLLLATALAGGIAWYVSNSQPKIYRATTTLLVNQTPDIQGPDYSSLVASQMLGRTYAQLIKRRPILEGTVKSLELPFDARYLERITDVKAIRDTQLVEVSAEYTDPYTARDIANTLAATFMADQLADQALQLGSSRQTLRLQIDDLEREIRLAAEALERAKASPTAKLSDVTALQNTLSERQATYAQLLRKEAELPAIDARAAQRVKVVEPAELPRTPVRPTTISNVLLGCLIGFLAACGLAFAVEYLDDTVRTEEDAQAAANLRTLTIVPRIGGTHTRGPRALDDRSSHSPVGEAYRVLRANVDLAWMGAEARVVMVTSANAGEGKTTTVANLARVLADDGRNVVAIDADLCKPSLHRAFGVTRDRGLSNVLADPRTQMADFLLPTRHPNLKILPSGPTPPNPSELLGSRRFGEILAALRRAADVVLIDAPPALGLVDSTVIGRQVSAAILVAEVDKTRARDLARASETVGRSCPRLLGIVLNKAGGRGAGYYYNYYRRDDTEGKPVLRPALARAVRTAAGLFALVTRAASSLLRASTRTDVDRKREPSSPARTAPGAPYCAD